MGATCRTFGNRRSNWIRASPAVPPTGRGMVGRRSRAATARPRVERGLADVSTESAPGPTGQPAAPCVLAHPATACEPVGQQMTIPKRLSLEMPRSITFDTCVARHPWLRCLPSATIFPAPMPPGKEGGIWTARDRLRKWLHADLNIEIAAIAATSSRATASPTDPPSKPFHWAWQRLKPRLDPNGAAGHSDAKMCVTFGRPAVRYACISPDRIGQAPPPTRRQKACKARTGCGGEGVASIPPHAPSCA